MNSELKSVTDNVRLELYIKNELAASVDKLGKDMGSAITACNI